MNEIRYSINDECPACKKSVAHMFNEHKKLIHLGNLLVCVRCGCIFLPKSQIKYILEGSESRIINPSSPEGQIIQSNLGGQS